MPIDDTEAHKLLSQGINLVISRLLDSGSEEYEKKKKQLVIDFIYGVCKKRIGLDCYLVGDFTSNVSKLLCPVKSSHHQKVDLTVFFDPERDNSISEIWYLRMHEALCKYSCPLEDQAKTKSEPSQIVEVERISYFPREARFEAVIDDIVINVVPNDISSFAFASLLEDMDRAIGRDSILKRSILFIKAWCLSEAYTIYVKDQKGDLNFINLSFLVQQEMNTHTLLYFFIYFKSL